MTTLDDAELIARLRSVSTTEIMTMYELTRRAADALQALDKRVRELEGADPAELLAAIAAGDGTLHGAIDYWQDRAERAEAERDAARSALENCRLLAAKNRHGSVEWQHIIRFCKEGGVTGSPIRAALAATGKKRDREPQ